MTSSGFDAIPLLPSLQRTLAEVGFTDPTEVQALALPGLLAGRGTVAVAETGSGKTLAYGLALLDRLKRLELDGDAVRSGARPRGLVVVPGRELGEQVAAELKRFTHDTRLRVRVALGGTRKAVSRERTAGPFEVLVATPGRLEQLLDDALTLDDLRLLVFDEADELLDPGFLPAARRLVAAASDGVQLVVEAVPEKIELKQSIFEELGQRLGPTVLLATNTSSLPISLMIGVAMSDCTMSAMFSEPSVS